MHIAGRDQTGRLQKFHRSATAQTRDKALFVFNAQNCNCALTDLASRRKVKSRRAGTRSYKICLYRINRNPFSKKRQKLIYAQRTHAPRVSECNTYRVVPRRIQEMKTHCNQSLASYAPTTQGRYFASRGSAHQTSGACQLLSDSRQTAKHP